MAEVGIRPSDEGGGLTGTQWLICVIAAIGFAFDIYELLMLPLIVRPALLELGGLRPGTAEFSKWFSLLFYVPALAGGVFGLLGGYLTDRLGRRRVLTWSILLYAFGAFFAGFSTSLGMLLFFRCLVFIGVCVEFVAAVAWLAELFPDPHRREKILGYTQAFSSIGGFMVAYANGLAVDWSATLPAVSAPSWVGSISDPHAPWRYTLMSGLIPAIPLIFIRPFLPESPVWAQRRAAGTLKRPSIAQLFAPSLRRTTIVTTIMFACSLGAAFGAIQQMPQIVPGLPDVQASIDKKMAESATVGAATSPASPLPGPETTGARDPKLVTAAPSAPTTSPAARSGGGNPRAAAGAPIIQKAASDTTKVQEAGGLVGRFLLAVLAVRIVSRRSLIRIFQIPGLLVIPIVFAWAATKGLTELKVGMFFAGLLTVAQLSFWGNYLPRVYPIHLRGTGESFAANIGGRMIGTTFAAVTAMIAAAVTPDNTPPVQAAHYWAYTAAAVGFAVYLIGFACSFFLPEPGHEDAE